MQASSEAPGLEEHQISDPPLMSYHVGLCIAFFVCLCITFSDLVLDETQMGDPPLPPQCTCIFVDIGIYILCILIVSNWCLKSTQSGSLLVRHHDPPLLTHIQ